MAEKTKYDNTLLVEFDFVANTDLGVFFYIKKHMGNSPYLNPDFMELNIENVNLFMMYRQLENPISMMLKDREGVDTTPILKDIFENHKEEVLEYSEPYDTFYMFNTFMKNASSVAIDILCSDESEAEWIRKHGTACNIIIEPDRRKIDLNKYTALYLKYFSHCLHFKGVAGKHIYIASAKYNFEFDDNVINVNLSILFSDVNAISLIDQYTKLKFRFPKSYNPQHKYKEVITEDESKDILEHREGDDGSPDSAGYAWFNF